MNQTKVLLTLTFLFAVVALALSQNNGKKPENSLTTTSADDAVHEMLFTEAGLLAFDSPKEWKRCEGPGVACFVPKGSDLATSLATIYISGAPIGRDQEDKSLNDYIRSDISGFKARFHKGDVHQEQAIQLPVSKIVVPVYTFRSGEEHNSVEQVAYIQDTAQRVLTVVLSAKTDTAFSQSMPVFQDFVKSFRGSIVVTSEHNAK